MVAAGEAMYKVRDIRFLTMRELLRGDVVLEAKASCAIVIVLGGRIAIKANSQSWTIGLADCVRIHDDCPVELALDSGLGEVMALSYECFLLQADGTPAPQLQERARDGHPQPTDFFSLEGNWQAACREMAMKWERNTIQDRLLCDAMLIQLLCASIGKSMYSDPVVCESGVASAAAYMEQHFDEDISNDRLAKRCGLSTAHFREAFKSRYGCTAMDYLSSLRMGYASGLINQTEAKLNEISVQVGIQDEFYFSRKFKKAFGISPSEYRTRHRRRVASCTFSGTGQLLALQVIPHAAPLHGDWTEYYARQYGHMINVHLKSEEHLELNDEELERLAATEPELILASDLYAEGERSKLNRISDVLYLPSSAHWSEQLQLLADRLELGSEAERWIRLYNNRVYAVRTELARYTSSRTIMSVGISGRQLYIYGEKRMGALLHHELELSPACEIPAKSNYEKITKEGLEKIDPDILLLVIWKDPISAHTWKQLSQSRLWKELKAVRTNQVHHLPVDPWLEYSAYAHARALGIIQNRLSANHPWINYG